MFSTGAVLVVVFGYMAVLFAIAYWAGRRSSLRKDPICRNRWVYSLSLGVYCTTWTFYASVGSAANSGILFLAIYVGSTAGMIFAWTVLRKFVRLKTNHHITSIADFISSRYSKSLSLAALATLICLVGILPYIALQLKAIVATFRLLTASAESAFAGVDIELLTVALMTLFTILFGVRKLDPTERHQSVMFVLAVESLVKLAAFLAVGLFVVFGLFDGFDDLFAQAEQRRGSIAALNNLTQPPDFMTWGAFGILSMAAILFLPRQFHVAVVENSDEEHLTTAQWLFPLYLLLINIFVLPIAAAGLILGLSPAQADTFVLTLPLQAGENWLSMAVFIGGFSAGTGMIMISAMALSTMMTNHLLLPVIDYLPPLHNWRRYLLQWRWLAVVICIVGGYLFNRSIGDSFMLINMGVISFVAILQFAPACVGGLFWREGNWVGAIAGLSTGAVLWFVTMMVPALVQSGWVSSTVLSDGLFGWALLKPEQLFGLTSLAPLPHAVFWTLMLNVLAYVIGSLLSQQSKQERALADEFIDCLSESQYGQLQMELPADIALIDKQNVLSGCFSPFLSNTAVAPLIERCVSRAGLEHHSHISILELARLQKSAEALLAGLIGGALAHQVIHRSLLFSDQEQRSLADVYSGLLAEIHLSPDQLMGKVNYYQERERLLAEHSEEQAKTIERLEAEVLSRLQAEAALQQLNDELEKRVESRTCELRTSNESLQDTLDKLRDAQQQLVESEKMAALGGLVAGVAHEINTPLGNSLTASSLLTESCKQLQSRFQDNKMTRSDLEVFTEQALECLDIIQSNGGRAAQLVKRFKQVAVDQTSDERRSFAVVPYLREVLESLQPAYHDFDYQMSVQGPNSLTVDSYPGALSQILTNLVSNAVLHGFHQRQQGSIVISLQQEEDQFLLCCQDDGEGMDQEQLSKVFDPFYTTKRGAGGSGLGAHVVYNLVSQRLGGSIECQSEKGQGTRFMLRLPITAPEQCGLAATSDHYVI